MAVFTNFIDPFDLGKALNGSPVTFVSKAENLPPGSMIANVTGTLVKDGGFYKTTISGVDFTVDEKGANMDTKSLFTQLYLVRSTMGFTRGTSQGWNHDEGVDPGSIASLEPRDQFALAIMQAIVSKMPNATSVEDSTILQHSYAAYRWAQGLMIAAADQRAEASGGGSSTIVVSQNDLQGNSEKILYNIAEYMKNGITVKGTDETGTKPILTNVEYKTTKVSGESIAISYSVYKSKFIRMEFPYNMAYSDISVVFDLAVTEESGASNRKVSFIIPKGSVIVVENLDADVVTIEGVNSASVRGKDVNDPNHYTISPA